MSRQFDPSSSAHPELSALLDGELDASEELRLRERLAADVALRLELRSASVMRNTLRSLEPVEVPEGALDRPSNVFTLSRPIRRRRARRSVGAAVAAVAAAWVFVLIGVSPAPAQAVPAVGGSVDAHRVSVQTISADTRAAQPATSSFPQQVGDGMRLQFVSRHGSQVHAMYANDENSVSIFSQPGVLAWEELPDGGSWVLVDGTRAWTWDEDELRVVVFERDDTIFTFVSGHAGERPSVTTASNSSVLADAQSPAWWTALSKSCHRAASLLGFG